MRLLLDTNILIDFFNEREGFYEDALRLLMSGYHGDNELWASASSFTDIFYILTRSGIDRDQLQDAFINSLDYLRICPIDQGRIDVYAAQARSPLTARSRNASCGSFSSPRWPLSSKRLFAKSKDAFDGAPTTRPISLAK